MRYILIIAAALLVSSCGNKQAAKEVPAAAPEAVAEEQAVEVVEAEAEEIKADPAAQATEASPE